MASIKWVYKLDYDNVDFELDLKSVVDSVTSQSPNYTGFGSIIEE